MQDARCMPRSSVSHPNKYQNMVYENNRWHNYVLSLYILVVPTIKDFITRLTKLVFLQTNQDNRRDIIIHFWTLRASTHERPPCVLRHMGNAYAVSHIFTHTLPSTIETAHKRSTLNGQRFIRHDNVFTSRTVTLREIPDLMLPGVASVSRNRITNTLPCLPQCRCIVTE